MRPKKNSAWLSPFDPYQVNNHFTEANSWQYSFFVPQDKAGTDHGMVGQFENRLFRLRIVDCGFGIGGIGEEKTVGGHMKDSGRRA